MSPPEKKLTCGSRGNRRKDHPSASPAAETRPSTTIIVQPKRRRRFPSPLPTRSSSYAPWPAPPLASLRSSRRRASFSTAAQTLVQSHCHRRCRFLIRTSKPRPSTPRQRPARKALHQVARVLAAPGHGIRGGRRPVAGAARRRCRGAAAAAGARRGPLSPLRFVACPKVSAGALSPYLTYGIPIRDE